MPSWDMRRRLTGRAAIFLRVNYDDLRKRVLEGGSDEEILEWCYRKGRRLNEGDLRVWNGFAAKLGWNDFAAPLLKQRKQELGVSDRADIQTMGQLFDFEEGRMK
jgi:hypothetical protein